MRNLARLDGAGTPFDWPEAIGYGRQPFVSMPSGAWMCVAGPDGLAVGAFCWVDPDTGEASNVQAEGALLGFALPVANPYNLWERAFIRAPCGLNPFAQQIVRPGVQCVIAIAGDFIVKFPQGGAAGSKIGASPFTGLPYTGGCPSFVTDSDGEIVFDSYGNPVIASVATIPTPWTLAQGGGPGSRLRMSSFIQPFN